MAGLCSRHSSRPFTAADRVSLKSLPHCTAPCCDFSAACALAIVSVSTTADGQQIKPALWHRWPRFAVGRSRLLPQSRCFSPDVAAAFMCASRHCLQAQEPAYQPGPVHPAAGVDPAGALREQNKCPPLGAQSAGPHPLAPRRYSPHVSQHQPDWIFMDHDALDAAAQLCQLPQQAWGKAALPVQGCTGACLPGYAAAQLCQPP